MSRLYYFLSERRSQFTSCLDEHGVGSDVTLGINGVFWPSLLSLQQVDSGILTCTWFPLDSPHLTLEYPTVSSFCCRGLPICPPPNLRRPSKSFPQTSCRLRSRGVEAAPAVPRRHSHPLRPPSRCVEPHLVTFSEKEAFEAPDSSYLTLT